jgi:hypothetical protein
MPTYFCSCNCCNLTTNFNVKAFHKLSSCEGERGHNKTCDCYQTILDLNALIILFINFKF